MGVQLPLQLALRDSATFANFVAAGQGEVVQALQHGTEPLIYLAGATGTGKTHLLQAACHAAATRECSVAYVPLLRAAEFGLDCVAGLEHIERVCLDDIHAVAGQMPWERALFNLFNRLRDNGGHLIVAATHKASQLPFALPDLSSRLNWGVTYGLQLLDDADKITALRLRAQARGFELPDEVGRYLLSRLPRDMHALFAVLDQLDYASLAAQRRLTVPFIKTIIA
ncbi:MAG: DnaA regulatory inactivator Hda [Gammaproteobacteria bacterium]